MTLTQPIDNTLNRMKAWAHWKRIDVNRYVVEKPEYAEWKQDQLDFIDDIEALLEALEVQRKALEWYAENGYYNQDESAREALAEVDGILKGEK